MNSELDGWYVGVCIHCLTSLSSIQMQIRVQELD